MKNSKVSFLGILFFLICASLIGGVYFLDNRIKELKIEYDDLEQRRVNLESDSEFLTKQKSIFTAAFNELENDKDCRVNVAVSEMAFYSDVQQVARNNNVEFLTTSQQGVSSTGRSSLKLILKGDYYAMMQVLAEWRNLPTTVRVANLSLVASNPPASAGKARGYVQADVTVEAIVGSQK